MSDIYIFPKDAEDLTTFGLVGALEPTSCIFEEEANGISEITLEHPLDEHGKYAAIDVGCLLVCDVPVRMTPEINGTAFVTSVEKTTVKDTATKLERTVYSKWQKGKKVKTLDAGTVLSIVASPYYSNDRVKIKCTVKKKSVTGWISRDALNTGITEIISDNANGIEEAEPSWVMQSQIFRIYEVEKQMHMVRAYARHITYDLIGNLTMYASAESTKINDAIQGILTHTVDEHDFTIRTNMLDERTQLDYFGTNPISALLDPEEGITSRFMCSLIRDNYEMTILKDAGMNRGVLVKVGRNLTDISYKISYEDVCTAVIPVGQTEDGKRLFLSSDYANKPDVKKITVAGTDYYTVYSVDHIEDYPEPRIQFLEVSDAKLNKKNGVTSAIAMKRMYEAAQAVFAAEADLPSIEMSVEFVNLGDTEEYAQYKDLERLFLWDYVTVQHGDQNINLTSRVVGISWNVVTERMISMQLGKIGTTLANAGISTWQIPSGFNGSKIASGTISGGSLSDDIINARHIQAETIGADQIAANAITSAKIAAGTIEASDINTQSLSSAFIYTDLLRASIASIAKAEISDADIDFAKIKIADIGTGTMDNLIVRDQANADKVWIERLKVRNAQLVTATVNELILKATNNRYYRLDIDDNGAITPVDVTVTLSEGEITAGVTKDGHSTIIETDLTVTDLATSSFRATTALINEITADLIDVKRLVAKEAFIGALETSRIFSKNGVIRLIAEEAVSDKPTIYRQETAPPIAKTPIGSLWVKTSTGQTYQLTETEKVDWRIDTVTGNLQYQASSVRFRIGSTGNLEADGLPSGAALSDEGTLAAGTWVLVQDSVELAKINADIDLKINDAKQVLEDKVDGKTTTFYGDEPENPEPRDIWYDTVRGKIFRRNDTNDNWVDITENALKSALDAAGDARSIADLKIVTFAQDEEPKEPDEHPSEGDLWIDTNDGNKLYRYHEKDDEIGEWVNVQDAAIEKARQLAFEKCMTFAQDNEPNEPTQHPSFGDLWIDTDDNNRMFRYNGSAWIDVQDKAYEAALSAAETSKTEIKSLKQYVDIEPTGLYIKDERQVSTMRLTSGAVEIGEEGLGGYAKFDRDSLQFGNYELRMSSDGGLVFKLKE